MKTGLNSLTYRNILMLPDNMKRINFTRWILILILSACSGGMIYGQSYCPNSNFSAGNFTNWEGFYGDFFNPSLYTGFITTGSNPRHVIIKSPGTLDHHACDSLRTVAPGEAYSARLGNDNVGAEAEVLTYTMLVTPENNLFIYKYAVVLEDPGHDPDHQPSFTIEVKNQAGQLFDPQCGYYYVYAQPGLPGWHSCYPKNGTVVWKDWTTVGLDLSTLVGETVTISFTTRDCEETGHFGYAYLCTSCAKLQLTVGFCMANNLVTATAPPGFSYLWSTGDTTQSITVVNPVPGTVESCTLTAVNGCQVTIEATIQPTVLSSDFSFEPRCAEVPVPFSDKSTINQNTIDGWVWDFGDGSPFVSNDQNPQHAYATPGTYDVSLIIRSSDPCFDTIVKPITIPPLVYVKFGDDVYLKYGTTVTLDAGNPGATYLWSTGETSQVITTGGEQTVWVVVRNDYCTSSDTILLHEYPMCIVDVPTAFSPNGDGQNDLLKVYGSGFKSFELLVFDRSGELVFQTTDKDNGWDGTFKGHTMGLGVFNYILRGTCSDGDPFFKKGNITLLR